MVNYNIEIGDEPFSVTRFHDATVEISDDININGTICIVEQPEFNTEIVCEVTIENPEDIPEGMSEIELLEMIEEKYYETR